jgi:hypothetical protein
LQRSDREFDHRVARGDGPLDRRPQTVVAEEGGRRRWSPVPVPVGEAHRLYRPARVHGRLEHRGPKDPVVPAAERGALGEGHHRAAAPQAFGHRVDHRGQLTEAAPFDGNDTHQPCGQSDRRPVHQVGASDETARQDRPDREDVHPGRVVADHQYTGEIADGVAAQSDSHAEAEQHESAVSSLQTGAPGKRDGQQRHRQQHQRHRDDPPHRADRYQQRRFAMSTGQAPLVANGPGQPGMLDVSAQRGGHAAAAERRRTR